jgi:hypothetical protein
MDSSQDQIGELLELAGVAKTVEARSALNEALEISRGAYDYELKRQNRAPSALFEQLDASIRKTLMLIIKLGKYSDTCDIAFEMHPIGTGIADAATGRKMREGRNLRVSRRPWVDKGIPRTLAEHVIVGINVENQLRAFQVRVRKARRKDRRGHPKRADKSSVVFHAADFFRAYSATEPSTDENNPFRPFVERFFEVATGTTPKNLAWQIRQALGNYDDPRTGKILWGKGSGEKQPKKHE